MCLAGWKVMVMVSWWLRLLWSMVIGNLDAGLKEPRGTESEGQVCGRLVSFTCICQTTGLRFKTATIDYSNEYIFL